MADKLSPSDIEYLYPVQSLTLHPHGSITVNRAARYKPVVTANNGKAEVRYLSAKSLRRLNHIMQSTLIEFNSMITLTYGKFYPTDGKIIKEDLRKVRQLLLRYTDNYLWFLEFQKRGAPHFHILTEVEAITPKMRTALLSIWVTAQVKQEYFWAEVPVGDRAMEWCKIVRFNAAPQIWEPIREKDGAKHYVAKYATKTHQKEVPARFTNVGRFWGCSRQVKKILGVTIDATVADLQRLLEQHNHKAAKMDYKPKYLWGVINE